MQTWSAHRFRQQAAQAGLPKDQAEAAWRAVRRLQDRGLPPILTLRHLAAVTEVPYRLLRGIVSRQTIRTQYRSFRMTKRSGGKRRIFVPTQRLQRVLRWIHDAILVKQNPHARAFAFCTERGPYDCAAVHCPARWLVKFDAKDFFESIAESKVYRIFRKLGYPKLLSFELARLTTVPVEHLANHPRPDDLVDPQPEDFQTNTILPVITDYIFLEPGVLGQGLATSPALSNLACRRLDAELDQLAQRFRFEVTRYADDITFSSSQAQLAPSEILQLRAGVERAMRQNGLRSNRRKFSVAGPGSRRVVLGLLVDADRPRLSRATRARLEGHLYFLRRHGPHAHAIKRGFESLDGLRKHLDGLLAYVRQVDPGLHAKYLKLASSVEWPPM